MYISNTFPRVVNVCPCVSLFNNALKQIQVTYVQGVYPTARNTACTPFRSDVAVVSTIYNIPQYYAVSTYPTRNLYLICTKYTVHVVEVMRKRILFF